RGHRDAVAVAHGHRPEPRPFAARPYREAPRRQLDIGPLAHAEIGHDLLEPGRAELVDEMRGSDARGMGPPPGHGHARPEAMAGSSLAGPSSSTRCAVATFEEWISVSGTFSEAPSGWLSRIVKPPIGKGVAG